MINPKVRDENSDSKPKSRRQALKTDNPVGRRILAALAGRDLGWLSDKSGVKRSTLSDSIATGVARADNALAIAIALDVSVDWLLTGREAPTLHASQAFEPLIVSEADWVHLPEFDLRQVTDNGLGPAGEAAPVRRDWLNREFGTSSGLWLARLLADYPPAELSEGALVFCADVSPVELRDRERQLCIFRINGGLAVGRYSNLPVGAAPQTGDLWVYSSQIGHEDNLYVPVARILGRFIGRL